MSAPLTDSARDLRNRISGYDEQIERLADRLKAIEAEKRAETAAVQDEIHALFALRTPCVHELHRRLSAAAEVIEAEQSARGFR